MCVWKECGGSSLCTHGRIKNVCKQCGGSSIRVHFHPRKIQVALQAMQGVWRLTFEFGNRVIIVNKKSRNKRTSIQII